MRSTCWLLSRADGAIRFRIRMHGGYRALRASAGLHKAVFRASYT